MPLWRHPNSQALSLCSRFSLGEWSIALHGNLSTPRTKWHCPSHDGHQHLHRLEEEPALPSASPFCQNFVGDEVMRAITLTELAYGVACSGDAQAYNKASLNSLLEDIPATPFEGQAARIDQPLRAAHKERQKDVQNKLIAAHAL
jgi:hypothetical protein